MKISSVLVRVSLSLLLIFCFSSLAQGNTDLANAWLVEQIEGDADASSENDLTYSFQTNSESLITLEILNITASSQLQALRASLLDSPITTTEGVSRQLIHRATIQSPTTVQVNDLLQREAILNSLSVSATGVGTFPYYDDNALETAFVLQAMSASSFGNSQVVDLLNYHVGLQNADGSFGNSELTSDNLYTSYQALTALYGFRLQFNLESQINNTANYINSQRNAAGNWGSTYETAIALLAVLPASADVDQYQAALDDLRDNQQANGSWENDAYITALAARAIHASENIIVPTPATVGNVTGLVVTSQGGAALSGAQIELVLASNNTIRQQAFTDSAGSFVASGIEAGDYILTVSQVGFQSLSFEITVTEALTANVGQIALSPSSSVPILGTVFGVVTDSLSGAPVANALVSVSDDSGTQVTQTDAAGQYSVSAVPGAITLSVAADTYDSVQATGQLGNGGTLNFSPQLFATDTTPANTASQIVGLIFNQDDSTPIADALISINGINTISSNAQGEFEIDNVTESDLTLTINSDGFISRTISVPVTPANEITLNIALLAEDSELPNSSVSGQVVNGDTNVAVDGVLLTLNNDTQISSDSNGEFNFADLQPGSYTLSLTKTGYLSAEYQFELGSGVDAQLTNILIFEDVQLTTSSLSGVVSNQTTGEAVVGAEVFIAELDLQTTTDAAGQYQFTDITQTAFNLTVSSPGFFTRTSRVSSEVHGDFVANIALQEAIGLSDLSINSVQTDLASYPAFSEVELTAFVENASESDAQTIFYIRVTDDQGRIIEERAEVPIPLNGEPEIAFRSIPAGQEVAFEIAWFTNANPAGNYEVTIQAFTPRGNQLLSQNTAAFTIEPTRLIGGLAEFNPPLAQLTTQEPIDILASIMNRGNVDIDEGSVTATVSVRNVGVSQNLPTAEAIHTGRITSIEDALAMTQDAQGNTYVLDGDTHSISRILPTGEIEVIITDLEAPTDIDIDDDGVLYVLNNFTLEQRVVLGSAIDIFATDLSRTRLQLNHPTIRSDERIEVTDSGDIYFTDGINEVYQVQPNGDTTLVAGLGLGVGYRDIVKNSQGDLFLSDFNQDAVFRFSSGQLTRFADIEAAHGLAIDSADNIYVTGYLNNDTGTLSRISPSGEVSLITSGLNFPWDVSIEAGEASFIVTNNGSNELLRISAAGTITKLIESTSSFPTTIAYSPSSELFFYDGGSGFRDIRKFVSPHSVEIVSDAINSPTEIEIDESGQIFSLERSDIFQVAQDGSESQRVVDTTSLVVVDFEVTASNFLMAEFNNIYQSDSTGEVTKIIENPFNNFRPIIDKLSDGSPIIYRNSTTNLPSALVSYDSSGFITTIPVNFIFNTFIVDLEVSSTDQVYLSNATTDSIIVIEPDGSERTLAELNFDPAAIGLDEANNRLIVGQSNSRDLHSIDLDTGAVNNFAILPRNPHATSPTIEIDSAGSIWLRDSSSQLVRVSSDGSQIDTFSDLGGLTSIHLSEGVLYAQGQFSTLDTIFRIASDGSSATVFSSNGDLDFRARGFVISNGLIHAIETTAINIIDSQTNELVERYVSIAGLDSIAESNVPGEIIGVINSTLVNLVPGQMPRFLTSISSIGSVNVMEKDSVDGQYILSGNNFIARFDRRTLDATVLASSLTGAISDIAVAPNGNIATTSQGTNSTMVFNSAGDLLSNNIGLIRPQGVLVEPSGNIVLSNDFLNNIYEYVTASQTLSPFFDNNRVLQNIEFIDLADEPNVLHMVGNGRFVTADLANRDVFFSNIQSSFFGENLHNNIIVQGNSVYGVRRLGQEYSFLNIDRNTLETDVFTSGLNTITDIESFQDQLFVLSSVGNSVDALNQDGSLVRTLSDLSVPTALYIESNGNFHITSANQLLTVYDGSSGEIDSTIDFEGLLPTSRPVTTFSLSQDEYLVYTDVDSQIDIIELGASNQQPIYAEGDVLFTSTLPIEALQVDSPTSVALDFGDWLPPIDGDFSVTVTHSETTNSLANILHVGGSANGTLGVNSSTVFPGDRTVRGSLNIIGADFTTISQINTDAVSLVAESGVFGRAVAGDSQGNIYASDNSSLVKVTPSGEVSTFVTGVRIRNGLAVDREDNIYAGSGRDILKISPAAEISTLTTLPGTSTFVTIDEANRIFASDSTTVFEISPTGEQTIIASLSDIRSIARDNANNTFVLLGSNRIVRIAPDGTISNYYDQARFEFEGVNMVTDCANNIIYAPVFDESAGKISGEEDIVAQINGTSGEASQIFFGPAFDSALADMDVLYFDRVNQRMLMYSDFSSGRVFSFPVICGGIDVDVVLTTRSDVDISTASPAPTSQTDIGDNQTRYFWDLSEVPNSGTNIDLRFLFDNLVVDEERPALAEAYLEFTNSFTPDEVIRVPLDIPTVTVEQPVDLSVDSDRSQYVAFENVEITNIVENLSDAPYDGRLEFQIVDDNGDLVVSFNNQQVEGLEGFLQGSFNDEWNTAGVLVGSYTIESTLFDERGNVTATASAPFEIVDELDEVGTPAARLSTNADRSLYSSNDSVEISNLPANTSLNTILENVTLQVVVVDSDDQPVHEFSRSFVQLIPNFNQHYIDTYTFTNEPEGEYRIIGQLLSESGEVLAEDIAVYEVRFNARIDLTGNVSVAQPVLAPGDSQICTDTIENTSAIDIEQQLFRQLLLSLDDSVLLSEGEFVQDLDQNSSISLARSVDTSELGFGVYACSIQTFVDGVWVTLDTDFFEIDAPRPVLSANDDLVFLRRGLFGTAQVLTNDVIENLNDVVISVIDQPDNGVLIDAGSGIFNYRSQLTFLGQDEFTYQLLSPSTGLQDTASVLIDVGPGISCSVVPDHIAQSDQLVNLPEWARTPGDTIRPSRYAIEVLRVSNNDAFTSDGLPVIEHPSCTLSYTPNVNVNETVTVTYRVTDVDTNGRDYTSLNRTFTLTIDSRDLSAPGRVIIPILQLLLLEEEENEQAPEQ